jgi:hypothetical protein
VIVRCLSCHRVERRVAGAVVVEQPGGARRPADPARAAWDVVRRSLCAELGPIAGVCGACGQPLVADEITAKRRAYTIALGDAVLTAVEDGSLVGPAGALTVEEADALVDAGVPRARRQPFVGMFQGALLAVMIVPFVVWVLAIVVVVAFLSRADTLF